MSDQTFRELKVADQELEEYSCSRVKLADNVVVHSNSEAIVKGVLEKKLSSMVLQSLSSGTYVSSLHSTLPHLKTFQMKVPCFAVIHFLHPQVLFNFQGGIEKAKHIDCHGTCTRKT